MTTAPPVGRNQRSLWIAYLLWATAGYVGLHRYYLGYRDSGSLMAGVTGVFASIGLLIFWLAPKGKAVMMTPSLLILFAPMLAWHAVDAFLIPRMREREEDFLDGEDAEEGP